MSRPTAVGCYIFQGGFTVGVAERFKVLAHLEDGDFGVNTFQHNFPRVPVHTVVGDWPLAELAGKVDLLYGNPPCAPFSPVGGTISKAAKARGGWRGDPRLKCWDNLVSAALVIRPKVFVGESVPRFYSAGWELAGAYARRFVDADYEVTFVLHDIKFMGAGQQRRRVFLVAHKVALQFPTPNKQPATLQQVLEGLEDPGPYSVPSDEIVEVLPHLPYRGSLRTLFMDSYGHIPLRNWKGMGLHRPRFTAHRVAFDRPTGTVFGDVMVHPKEARYLGVKEYARLMGYPDGYWWDLERPGDAIGEMVKAVTPYAARYISRVAKAGLTAGKRAKRGRVTEVKIWASSQRVDDFKLVRSDTDITGRLP